MVTIKIKNVKEYKKAFRELARLGQLTALNAQLKQKLPREMQKIQQKAFNSEGGSTKAGKWKALSPAYKAQKDKTHPGKTILRRTDKMHKELVSNIELKTAIGIVKQKYEFWISKKVDYWKYHQAGTEKIPARKTVSLKNADEKRLVKILYATILHICKRAGIFDKISLPFPTWKSTADE